MGNDTIDAGNGADKIWGGAGNDIFVFTRGGDMDNSSKAVDIYMDFTQGADKFDLKMIDANTGVSGDQAFGFIGEASFDTNKVGQIDSYDGTNNVTRVELSTDKIEDDYLTVSGKHTFAASTVSSNRWANKSNSLNPRPIRGFFISSFSNISFWVSAQLGHIRRHGRGHRLGAAEAPVRVLGSS